MSGIDWLEIFGYVAMVLTGISLSMSSMIKLRWCNMAGSFCFGTYGLFLEAWPVVGLNYYLVAMNIYYLRKIYTEKAHFKLLPSSVSDVYLQEFINLHLQDARALFPTFHLGESPDTIAVMIHRDLVLAGVFICHKTDEHTAEIDLDFILSPYRDLKPGRFLFTENSQFFKERGIQKLRSATGSEQHRTYLEKIGFVANGDKLELLIS